MHRVRRFVLIGGVTDYTIYVTLSLAALLAREWGAGPMTLGALPVAWGLTYSLTAALGGRLSDRVSRTTLARGGLALVVLVAVGFSLSDRIWQFFVGFPLVAFGMAFFWPSLQAAIADESDPGSLTRNLGLFNVSWSLGKGLGVLTGGVLSEFLGKTGFLLAAGTAIALLFAMPRVPHGGGRGGNLVTESEPVPRKRREAFRGAALLANFAAFGAATTIINHFPYLNRELGRGGVSYGILVGAIFLAQTAAFGTFLMRSKWHYRAGLHLLLQAGALVGVLLVATGWPLLVVLPFMILVGQGFGLAYYASIYYSLHSDVARGGRAGLHESIIGTGNFLVPLLGGVAARVFASSVAPYLFAGAVVGAALVLQAVLLFRRGVR